jgi:hypothetical protein
MDEVTRNSTRQSTGLVRFVPKAGLDLIQINAEWRRPRTVVS